MRNGAFELEADGIENAQHKFKINTKDTHRDDRKNIKQNKRVHKLRKETMNMRPKNKLNYSATRRLKEFTWIYFSVIPPLMTSFNFKVLDTMGYPKEIFLRKESSICSSTW